MNINYSDFDTQKKNEILEEKPKYNDIEDLVYRMQPTFDEVSNILDFKYILPDNVEVSVTIDAVRLKSNLKINQTLIFTKKSFFLTILGFTR